MNFNGYSTNYKVGFRTKEDYILYLKNELAKKKRDKEQAEYEITKITKELNEEGGKI